MPVEITRRGAGKKLPSRGLKKIAQAILAVVGQADAELSLALIGNAEMQMLNAKYRGKDYPTDVLSFPMAEGLSPAGHLLGDVIISVEKARQQAEERGRSRDKELATLLIHGIVHLLGYDHERDDGQMARLERRLRQRGGLREGLIERA